MKMKLKIHGFLFLAVVGSVAAQSLAPCAQTCINNMGAVAQSQFGCAADDSACLCNSANWASGVRDCGQQTCSAVDVSQAIFYVTTLCSALTSVSSAAVSTTRPASVSSLAQSAPTSAINSAASASAGFVSIPSSGFAISTSPVQSSTAHAVSSASDVIATPSGTAPSVGTQQKAGLSTGAKAGIGVVVPLAVLLLTGLLFMVWRRKKRTAPARTSHPPVDYSGLMVQSHERQYDPTKPELDSAVMAVKPELAGTSPVHRSELASPPNAFKAELSSTPVANRADLHSPSSQTLPPPPMYAHHQAPNAYGSGMHELPTHSPSTYHPSQSTASAPIQQYEPSKTYAAPTAMGTVEAAPTDYDGYGDRLEQLRVQRAAVARERERKEEIDRMRAEEDRLDKAIAELESRRR